MGERMGAERIRHEPAVSWPWQVARSVLGAPAWAVESELLDHGGHPPDDLRGNLDDLALVNRFLGGASPIIRGINLLLDERALNPGVSILDVGTGGGDLPARIASELGNRHARQTIVGLDVQSEILELVARGQQDSVVYVAGDGRRLPFADRRFHIAMCSMVLHHLEPADARSVILEMGRVASHGIVVNDLIRTWHGYAGARALARVGTRNRLTRADAPLSMRRAYTERQLRTLVESTGMQIMAVNRFLGFRVTITARHPT